MQIRKWLALLVSAALALSLLAGCGNGSKALSDVIADLLSGQYANVTVEIDPDLEGDLRQAVHEGETDAEIHAALEKILGSGVSFRLIGDGQQGDSAWDLILYPGSDPDAAARSAFTEWNKVFGSLPRDGQYTAQIAMIETENGYAILVKATVDKAASRDDDDDDDEPEEPEDLGYTVDDDNYTVNTPDGLQELFTKEWSKASTATITLPEGEYNISGTFGDENTPFMGTLKGEDKETTIIKLTDDCNGLFKQISGGTVENITFEVQTNISNTYRYKRGYDDTTTAGAVAGQNNGTIQNCDVTINAGGSITATSDKKGSVYAGGIAGENGGKISNCHVNGGDNAPNAIISAADGDNTICAGGIAGCNRYTGAVDKDCSASYCKIKAEGSSNRTAAGGIVGLNEEGSVQGSVPSTSVTENSITATATDTAGNVASATVPTSSGDSTALDGKAGVYAGTKIGYDNEPNYRPVGW